MSDSLRFGTSGLRGLVGDLTGPAVAAYTHAFIGQMQYTGYIAESGQFLVGRDLRESSPAIAAAVIAAARTAGLLPVDCGVLPAPALALHAIGLGAPAIMVTGSHIPADRNGLKFFTPAGEITKSDEAGITESLELLENIPSPDLAGLAARAPEALKTYLDRCRLILRGGALEGKRIGVWQHSGVLRDDLVSVLSGLGAHCEALGRESSFVPIDTEAVSTEHAAQIRAWVLGHGLDALVSTDGDGDRPLMADETGAIIRGDALGILAARFLGADVVATPVTSNSAIESLGFTQVIRTRVGSPYVIEGMERGKLAGGVVVGFEANGGLLLATPVRRNGAEIAALPTRDAMLPILSVLGLVQETGRTLSQLVAGLPPRFARSDRLQDVAPERGAALLAQLGEGFFADIGPVAGVSRIDGERYTLASGEVIHYRPSGNAPELRCYTEAATPERADELLAWGLAAAERVVR